MDMMHEDLVTRTVTKDTARYSVIWTRIFIVLLGLFLVLSCGRGTTQPDGAKSEKSAQEGTTTTEASVEQTVETNNESSAEPTSDTTSTDSLPDASAETTKDDGTTKDGGVTDASKEQPPEQPVAENPPTEPGPPGKPDQSCGAPSPAPSGKLCTVTSGNKNILIIANILTPDKWIAQGQVLVDDKGKITCVGCNCKAQAAGATVLNCPKGYLTPGLINAHEHLGWATSPPRTPGSKERYEHRHNWRKGSGGHTKVPSGRSNNAADAIAWSEVRMLMSGTTSIAGSGYAPNLLRNLDSRGQRGGVPGSLRYDTFPLGDSNGKMSDSGCTAFSKIRKASSITEDAYIPHIAEGINAAARNEFNCTSRSDQGGQLLITKKTGVIHGVGLLPEDIRKMGAVGASLIWSPRSNIDLYGNTATVLLFLQLGVNVGLGTDWPLSGSMNMLRELACADYLNQNHFNRKITDRQLVQMATSGSAKATGVLKYLGTIEVGKYADLSLFDGTNNTGYRSVLDAKPQDVAMVMIGGKAKFGNEKLIDSLLGSSNTCELLIACASSKKICIKDDFKDSKYTIKDYAALFAKWNSKYPLFFCQTPKNEPSCAPFRDDKYGKYGYSRQGDKDGDGIEDAKDNCPNVFNPIRPMDNNKQADRDGDNTGDVCDPCPFDANTTTCKKFDPNDRDSDGIKNAVDNCPDTPNPKQEDADKDKIGDACDKCPKQANKPGEACSVSIYDVKSLKIKVGTAVLLKNLLVTALTPDKSRLTAQLKSTDTEYKGADYSGIFIYLGSKGRSYTRLKVGLRIDVEGKSQDYYKQIQLSSVTKLTVTTTQVETPPKPVLVKVADISSPSSLKAKKLEGLVVEVQNVVVTSKVSSTTKHEDFTVAETATATDKTYIADTFNATSYIGARSCFWNDKPAPGKGSDSECLSPRTCQCLSAPCKRGKTAKCTEPGKQPQADKRTVGDKFKSIKGPLQFTWGNYKIAPRDANDLVK